VSELLHHFSYIGSSFENALLFIMENNPQLDLAFNFVQYTNKNVFLTGNAGTGKTTFLHNLKKETYKRMVVVAPTGVAAINAGGVTIHSFFQLPFGPIVPENTIGNQNQNNQLSRALSSGYKFSKQKVRIIKSLDLLVIDEISMVRADLLDGIDEVLRRYKNRNLPFGGVQLLMIGDMHQLAPVVRENDWQLLKDYYDTVFFFSSRALKQTSFTSIELKKIYRQSDFEFIDLLGKVRQNKLDEEVLDKLNERYIPGFEKEAGEGYIILTTHNAKAREINEMRLNKLKTASHFFEAEVDGDFPEYSYPTEEELVLKEGAQVMFIKNDPNYEKQYYNGKIGTIQEIDEDIIVVKCPDDDFAITVNREKWENIKYELDEVSKEVSENVVGSFIQYPLKLAWAITIHKSQGLTFDRAIIDAQAAFAFGQVYVALSRCRSLKGMVLSSQISYNSIKSDYNIVSFAKEQEENEPSANELQIAKKNFQEFLLKELIDFELTKRRLFYFRKVVRENLSSLYSGLEKSTNDIIDVFIKDIYDVSLKFLPVLQKLIIEEELPEKNDKLQERISKASVYFLEKLEQEIKDKLDAQILDTDNKAVKKIVSEALKKVIEEIYFKKSCLLSCKNGFDTKSLLDARSKAAVEQFDMTEKKGGKSEKIPSVEHPELYKKLKIWRDKIAEEIDKPAFRVLRQKALHEITHKPPASFAEIKKLKGFGGGRRNQSLVEVFEIVREYCLDKGLPTESEDTFKMEKLPSNHQSFELFKSGKSISEIAKERGLANSTIEGHLLDFIREGELSAEKVLGKEKYKHISEYFRLANDKDINRAKSTLGEGVSYNELRMVLGEKKTQ
jgi:GTPase SAR1 family protein